MAFDIKQSLKLTQQLLMTPQLQQAIKLLQLSRLELEEFVAAQLSENPVLEEGVAASAEEKAQVEKERERTETQAVNEHMEGAATIVDKMTSGETSQEMDWESYSKHHESAAPIPASHAKRDDDQPNYENIVTKTKTLNEYLLTQIGELGFDEDETKRAAVIIGNIDDRGYLQSTLEEISESEGYPLEELEDVLDSIQRLEPGGVGARDLRECLLIQIRNNHLKNGVVEKIVELHLKELETRNYHAIAKALKVPLEKIIESVQIIAELEPIPGRQFSPDSAQYIIPDVHVFKVGDEWVVGMNEEGLPRLQVNKTYKNLIEGQKHVKAEEKEYISDKLKSAEWLIRSIQQRQRTIFRVTECIVKRQLDFFNKGIEFLKPMILKDIAEDVQMHESTISRVTTNKYVHTPRGIFELKYFFNSSVSKSDGDNLASESVKKMISDLIKSETPLKPLSDQKIVEMLEEKGIQLARRTVAKYREQMGVLPSSKRKKYF